MQKATETSAMTEETNPTISSILETIKRRIDQIDVSRQRLFTEINECRAENKKLKDERVIIPDDLLLYNMRMEIAKALGLDPLNNSTDTLIAQANKLLTENERLKQALRNIRALSSDSYTPIL